MIQSLDDLAKQVEQLMCLEREIRKCMNCEASRKLADCDKFNNMTVRQRRIFVRGRGLCLNCLKKGDFVSQCFAKSNCNLCPQKHHLLLHNAALDCVDPLAKAKTKSK